MGKLLGWVLVGLMVWVVWRFIVISKRRAERANAGDSGGGEASPSSQGARRDTPVTDKTPVMMMQCVVCGLHLPGTEVLFSGGKVFCSEAHRQQGAPVQADAAVRRDES
ncbi:MAG: PP0621 family protein [Burkholderiales bacterium]